MSRDYISDPAEDAAFSLRAISDTLDAILEAMKITPAPPAPEALDVERLAAAIRNNWYEIRPTGGEFVSPRVAAVAIAREYVALGEEPTP